MMFLLSSLVKYIPINIQNYINTFFISLLKQGPIPKHVAFIMDGNRRYARERGLATFEGHKAGGNNLTSILEYCGSLGVKEVSIYAFSIDNFNRTKEEVDLLMEQGRAYFIEQSLPKTNAMGVRVRIIGRLSLLSKPVQEACKTIIEATKNNTIGILNVYLPYTSTDEIAEAVNKISKNLIGSPTLKAFSTMEVEKSFYEETQYPLDLLVRTSGETRLSDFLLWQCSKHNPQISFINTNWPDLSILDLIPILMKYQLYTV